MGVGDINRKVFTSYAPRVLAGNAALLRNLEVDETLIWNTMKNKHKADTATRTLFFVFIVQLQSGIDDTSLVLFIMKERAFMHCAKNCI